MRTGIHITLKSGKATMLSSMTAFARTEASNEMGTLTWEMRSVNHRYLELSFRLPEDLRTLEQKFREKIAFRLNRGKVDCQLRYKQSDQLAAKIELNEEVIKSLASACERLNGFLTSTVEPDPIELLRWQGVIKENEIDVAPLHQSALESLDATLLMLVETREREGAHIQKMLQERCTTMSTIVAKVRTRRPQVQQTIREKLQARLADLNVTADPGRLEQELVFIAQKMDVDEELDRLETHISEVIAVLKRKEPVGRRLDFLMQELNREANTLGSKSGDIETTQAAVDLKVLIEQMREQVQNIE